MQLAKKRNTTMGLTLFAFLCLFVASSAALRNEGKDFSANLCHDVGRDAALSPGVAGAPNETPYLIGENCASGRCSHLKRVVLDLRGHRTTDHEACPPVVGGRAENQ